MENEQEHIEATGNNEGEIDGIKLENENLKRQIAAADGKILELEKTLAEKTSFLNSSRKALEEAKQAFVETSVDLSQAVSAYKNLAVQANPGLVADMVQGGTIAEIDASITHARQVVEKVKQEINAENSRTKVPAGAPPRVPNDFSALSARDKIKFAVGGK